MCACLAPIRCFGLTILMSTVFRELLQNADDASSKEVEIHFETRGYLDQQNANVNGAGGQAPPPDVRTALVSY